MAQLEPYTSTYTDVDGSVIDADDLVAEFWRVAYYLNLWGGSIDAIGVENRYEEYIEVVTGQLAEILPARGLIQRLEVDANVEEFEVRITEHTVGAPFRVYIVLRCRNPETRFMVSCPANESHIFSVNRSQFAFQATAERFLPSQVSADGFYVATIICTYGSERGVMVQVMAANPEETAVDFNDVLTVVPQ